MVLVSHELRGLLGVCAAVYGNFSALSPFLICPMSMEFLAYLFLPLFLYVFGKIVDSLFCLVKCS